MAHPLETYLRDLWDIRASGSAVTETSYYGPLATLLNEVGASLKPRVRCVINLKNQGAGLPDGGFFTPEQLSKASEPPPGQIPARGALEVKGTRDDAAATAGSAQVARYFQRYGQVLVTNYREFHSDWPGCGWPPIDAGDCLRARGHVGGNPAGGGNLAVGQEWQEAARGFTPHLSDDHFLAPDAVAIPVQLKNGVRLVKRAQATLFDLIGDGTEEGAPIANLSRRARDYYDALKLRNPDKSAEVAALIWMHALAVGFSPAYLAQNTDGIRGDWPRIPLPNSRAVLLASAALGHKVASLLDAQRGFEGVIAESRGPDLKLLGMPSRVGGGQLAAGDALALTAGWGYSGKEGVVMPGKGQIMERAYTAEERSALLSAAKALKLSGTEALRCLGETTRDVYLNDLAFWRNVPERVWSYTIGGHQVLKKWLSYRERSIVDRSLTVDELREVAGTVRRLASLLLMSSALDTNYTRAKQAAYPWPASDEL